MGVRAVALNDSEGALDAAGEGAGGDREIGVPHGDPVRAGDGVDAGAELPNVEADAEEQERPKSDGQQG